MSQIRVRIKRLGGNDDLPLPAYMTLSASALDLRAAIPKNISLLPGERRLIPTGFSLEIPQGFEAQIRPRSGLALDKGLGILNSPGTIDSDYRGEIKIIVINLGEKPLTIKRGQRIAQMAFQRVYRVEWEETDNLEISERGGSGFGHTGI